MGKWFQMWRCNEYGRAINAREKLLLGILKDHVSKERQKNNLVPARKQRNFVTEQEEIDDGQKSWLRFVYTSIMSTMAQNQPIFQKQMWSSARSCVGSNSEFILMYELMKASDERNNCLTEAAIADICLHLWLILDASTSWIALAITLLRNESSAFSKVQSELDNILKNYDVNDLFTDEVMKEMRYLDALIYEAIRICPPFCGGFWKTTNTVLMSKDLLQIPSGTNILLTESSPHPFDLEGALGTSPHRLGESYPNQALFGFLPYGGLEVPLMVLQTKVFLIEFVLRCDFSAGETSSENRRIGNENNVASSQSSRDTTVSNDASSKSPEAYRHSFSKMPFPEYMHSIIVKKRCNFNIRCSKT